MVNFLFYQTLFSSLISMHLLEFGCHLKDQKLFDGYFSDSLFEVSFFDFLTAKNRAYEKEKKARILQTNKTIKTAHLQIVKEVTAILVFHQNGLRLTKSLKIGLDIWSRSQFIVILHTKYKLIFFFYTQFLIMFIPQYSSELFGDY